VFQESDLPFAKFLSNKSSEVMGELVKKTKEAIQSVAADLKDAAINELSNLAGEVGRSVGGALSDLKEVVGGDLFDLLGGVLSDAMQRSIGMYVCVFATACINCTIYIYIIYIYLSSLARALQSERSGSFVR
jgi:hypothetical protein